MSSSTERAPVVCWRSLALIATAVLQCSLAPVAFAQSADAERKSVQMVRTDTPPVIDGFIDEAVWESAAVVDDFQGYGLAL